MGAFEIGLLVMTGSLCVMGVIISLGWFRTVGGVIKRADDERAADLLSKLADEAEPGETIIVRVGDVVVQTTLPRGSEEEVDLPF